MGTLGAIAIGFLLTVVIIMSFILIVLLKERKNQKRVNTRNTWINAGTESMGKFNFDRVAKVMKCLDWQWAECSYGVPSADDIRAHVENSIMHAIDGIMDEKSDRYFVSSGGIEVVATYEQYDPKIIIRFVAEESDPEALCDREEF